MKSFDTEIVSGSIVRSVWKLAWPTVLLNLTNGLHGFVDHILVGHYVGYEGNAGIGVAWSVFLVVVVFITSLYHGMVVLVARYAGQQDREKLSDVAFHTFLTSLYAIVLVLAPIGFVAAPFLLRFVNAAPEVQVHALPYMRVMFTCGAPIFLMLLVTFGMQASGDPKTPLFLGALSTALNLVFSYLLITGAGPFPALGATGAAIATAFAPVPSLLIGLGLYLRRRMIIQPPRHWTLIPDLEIMEKVVRIGLPTGFQAVLLNLAGFFLLRYLGALPNSAAAQAVYTICYSQLFSLVAWASWGLRNASSTLMGQNIGAGVPGRGKRAVYVAAAFGAGWAVAVGLLYLLIPKTLLGLFDVTEAHVVDLGRTLLAFLSVSGVMLALGLAMTGGLIGMGDTKRPMYIAFVTQIVVLIGLCELTQRLGLLTTTAIWAYITLSHGLRLLLTALVFRKGRYVHL